MKLTFLKMSKTEKIKQVFNQWALSGRSDHFENGHAIAVNEVFKNIA